ncbi:MAG: mannitol dehydrogenase family protein [Solirubrobacteraceae bacterium]
MSERLSLANVKQLPRALVPRVDPLSLPVGIVHLGIGAFHRAHQAVYTEDAVAAAGGDWGISGVSQRTATVVEQLGPQDGLYTLAERDGSGERLRVIAAVRELMWARAQSEAVAARIASPATRLVTLTVTEKGYHHDPATNRLRLDSPDVAADLADGGSRTVVGQVVQGVARRRADDAGPLTVLCCDNLPDNGHVVSRLVFDFVAHSARADGLGDWIAANVRFPSTMVDRITPATTDADRARIAAALGARDDGAVVTEPFTQWVIEDDFAAERPAWERAGAIVTADVRPYEQIKLRLLNGAHSALAYLAVLADEALVSDAVRPERAFQAVLRRLMADEVAPTLTVPDGFDLGTYQADLLERFANPALRHRTLQIAMDGSQKLPMRLLGTIRDRRRAGTEPVMASLGVAAWMRFVSARRSDSGRDLTVDDPLADEIAQRLRGREDPEPVVDSLLSMSQVFDPQLAVDPGWRALLVELLEALIRDGADRTARRLAA